MRAGSLLTYPRRPRTTQTHVAKRRTYATCHPTCAACGTDSDCTCGSVRRLLPALLLLLLLNHYRLSYRMRLMIHCLSACLKSRQYVHIHVDCFTLHLCLHTGRLVATTFRSISCWRSHASQPALLFAACSRPGRAGLLSFRPIPSSRMRFGLPASASPCDTISKHRLSRTSSASSIMCGGGSCIAASSAAGSRWTLCLVTG